MIINVKKVMTQHYIVSLEYHSLWLWRMELRVNYSSLLSDIHIDCERKNIDRAMFLQSVVGKPKCICPNFWYMKK